MVPLSILLACSSPESSSPLGDPPESVASDDSATEDSGDSGGGDDTSGSTDDTGDSGDSGGDDSGQDTAPAGLTYAECFAGQTLSDGSLPVDYDQYGLAIGEHCMGTDHQDIVGVEHVVFVGDSITVGTPPTDAVDWYRNRMADALSSRFGLESPSWTWENVDLFEGMTYDQSSGAFSSCAKWGARTDDIAKEPHEQLQTCIPEDRRDETTLVVMTVGGNDLFSWAQDRVEGMSDDEMWEAAQLAVTDIEDAVGWLTDDPSMFPGGLYLVFANTFEFGDTDAAQDFSTCPGADWISMDQSLVDPSFMAMAAWMSEEYARIASESGTDMIFLGEHACGHGYMRDDATGRCYRGSDNAQWLDITCMHPSADGHAGIAELFMAVIEE